MRLISAYVNLVAALAPNPRWRQIPMAKNKNNRDRKQQSERAQQSAEQSAVESRVKSAVEASPSDVARKHRERRFGHN
ncbi:hypothetical protein [Streptomyces sp. NPDC008150]|uniref:hypothetical protein n=2 Tax=unclassified Streptomyces TaxID=2593676 RepID=UPI0036E2A47E